MTGHLYGFVGHLYCSFSLSSPVDWGRSATVTETARDTAAAEPRPLETRLNGLPMGAQGRRQGPSHGRLPGHRRSQEGNHGRFKKWCTCIFNGGGVNSCCWKSCMHFRMKCVPVPKRRRQVTFIMLDFCCIVRSLRIEVCKKKTFSPWLSVIIYKLHARFSYTVFQPTHNEPASHCGLWGHPPSLKLIKPDNEAAAEWPRSASLAVGRCAIVFMSTFHSGPAQSVYGPLRAGRLCLYLLHRRRRRRLAADDF